MGVKVQVVIGEKVRAGCKSRSGHLVSPPYLGAPGSAPARKQVYAIRHGLFSVASGRGWELELIFSNCVLDD